MSKYSLMFDLAYKNLAIATRSRAASQGLKVLDRIPRDLPDRFMGVLDKMGTDLAAKDVSLLLSTVGDARRGPITDLPSTWSRHTLNADYPLKRVADGYVAALR
jgi:hypothetical protein